LKIKELKYDIMRCKFEPMGEWAIYWCWLLAIVQLAIKILDCDAFKSFLKFPEWVCYLQSAQEWLIYTHRNWQVWKRTKQRK